MFSKNSNMRKFKMIPASELSNFESELNSFDPLVRENALVENVKINGKAADQQA